jgi:hypothetical protein
LINYARWLWDQTNRSPSKDPSSPELGFSVDIFRRFTDEIRNGRHDLNG